MSWDETVHSLHRTVKLLIDSGKAKNPEEARKILENLVLQVAVGADIGKDPAAQAALLTIVNAGHRAFLARRGLRRLQAWRPRWPSPGE